GGLWPLGAGRGAAASRFFPPPPRGGRGACGEGANPDMNRALVDRIANAVLYEGYILYPYRPSVKNRQRWTFGGLYPEAYCQAQGGNHAWSYQTECLIHGTAQATLDVRVRFLHLIERRVGELVPPLTEWPLVGEPPYRLVEHLRVGEQHFQEWQEAEEREVEVSGVLLGEIKEHERCEQFAFPGKRQFEPLPDETGSLVGVLAREQASIEGRIAVL